MKRILINEFDKAFDILKISFPKDEIRTFDEQKELFSNPLYKMYKEEDMKGIMAVWEFDDFVFLEHFAVAPLYRNKGIGGKMLEELLKLTNKTICLEVEPPESDITIRRIDFYKRYGFFFNDFEYIQPSISNGRKPIPLFIMSNSAPINKEEFEKVKNILYKEVYKIDNLC